MSLLHSFIDLFLHIDKHLLTVVHDYGPWVYALFFLVIFCETGLVFMAILPGDSLLFAAGAFAAAGSLRLLPMLAVFLVAAIVGDLVNYAMGKHVGRWFFKGQFPFLKAEHLGKAEEFSARYGKKAIILARFVPIIRTFVPFVAGMGRMEYRTFVLYNIGGGILWVIVGVFAGYLFGNIPVVQSHFSVILLGIVFVSVLPAVFEYVRGRKTPRKA
jgi:membrane-associated protein